MFHHPLRAMTVLGIGCWIAACSDSPGTSTEGSGGSGGSTTTTGGVGGSIGSDGGGGAVQTTGAGGEAPAPPRVLLFSKTAGFRHASIDVAIPALQAEGADRGWSVQATEDAAIFDGATLAELDVIVFLMTTGDVLDDTQQAAFEGFIRAGGGFAGVHSASDTEYDWPWYGELVGAYFAGHPAPQRATVIVEDATHPSTSHLDATWVRFDEWYSFTDNPREDVNVLMALDESTYDPGGLAMGDHPIAWFHEYDGGRAFYTAGGHTEESYAEADFIEHVAAGIQWAGTR